MKRIAGILILLAFFVAIVASLAASVGWLKASLVFGGALVSAALVVVAVRWVTE